MALCFSKSINEADGAEGEKDDVIVFTLKKTRVCSVRLKQSMALK